jgi:hypothetical protein
MSTATRRTESPSFARERNRTIQTAIVTVDTEETVGEDSTIEEGAELPLDEARDGPLPDARVSEPGLQMMLDHPIEGSRLRTARGVFGGPLRLSEFSHVAIVVSGSGRAQQVMGIEFPRHNGWRRDTVPAAFHYFST